jgi:hypothetical protein
MKRARTSRGHVTLVGLLAWLDEYPVCRHRDQAWNIVLVGDIVDEDWTYALECSICGAVVSEADLDHA